MKKSQRLTAMCLTALVLLGTLCSCSSDENTVSTTGDCAVTSVVMGTLYRNYTTYKANGEDTTYVITLPGNYYPLHIDHLKGRIYNTDSLPQGTMTNKVRFSTFSADGVIAYRLDSGKDTLYTTSDTLDLTRPRIFTIHASNGMGSKQYTLTLNVAQTDPQTFSWRYEQTDDKIAGIKSSRLFVRNDSLVLFGLDTEGALQAMLRSTGEVGTWTTAAQADVEGLTPENITLFQDRFYGVAGGKLYVSDNARKWTLTGDLSGISRMIGAGSAELYVQQGTEVLRSTDGIHFTADELDEASAFLPEEEISTARWASKSNPDIENILMAGFGEGEPRIWKKEINLKNTETNPWSYYPITEENHRTLPEMGSLNLLSYNDCLYAYGVKDEQLQVWISQDGGRTWRQQTRKGFLPEQADIRGVVNATADAKNYVWLVCPGSGQVWRGRLNGLSAE